MACCRRKNWGDPLGLRATGRRHCQRPPALLLRSAERTLRVPLARELFVPQLRDHLRSASIRSARFPVAPAFAPVRRDVLANVATTAFLRTQPRNDGPRLHRARSYERRYIGTNVATCSGFAPTYRDVPDDGVKLN